MFENTQGIGCQLSDVDMQLSATDLEKRIMQQSRALDVRIPLLQLAIKRAITNPTVLRLAKQGEGYDLLGYHDAFHYLAEALNNRLLVNVDQPPSDYDIDSTMVYDIWQKVSPNLVFDGQVCVHHSHIILNMLLGKESYAMVRRLLGFHQLSTHQTLWRDKSLVLSVPFEYYVFLDKSHLQGFGGSVKPEWLFYLEPLNAAFHHHISPAPVAGVTAVGESYTHGFISHPNILASYMDDNDDWKDHRFLGVGKDTYAAALAFDSTLSLKLLKYRYGLPILSSHIEHHEGVDNQMYETMKREGHVILEY